MIDHSDDNNDGDNDDETLTAYSTVCADCGEPQAAAESLLVYQELTGSARSWPAACSILASWQPRGSRGCPRLEQKSCCIYFLFSERSPNGLEVVKNGMN